MIKLSSKAVIQITQVTLVSKLHWLDISDLLKFSYILNLSLET